jgi:hypothetical protein
MLRTILAAALWLLAPLLYGQITVTPTDSEVGQKIVATVQSNIPDGATFSGGWSFACDSGACLVEYEPLKDDNTIGIWARKSGDYKIKFSGFWIALEEVTFTDGSGKEITITAYKGHGFISEEAEFKVTGGAAPEPPDPPEPPQPGGPFKIVMFYDASQLDNLPAGQRSLLTSLKLRQQLKEQGHDLLEILESSAVNDGVSVKYKAFIDTVKGDPLPRIAFCPIEGGFVLDFPLPTSYEDLLRLLKSPAIADYYDFMRETKQ